MKKLFQIGILLLFVIGLCSVQLEFSTPTLVDDDVGVEFAIDNLEDVILLETITTPGQVAHPLKYLTITSGMDNTGNRNQEIWCELNNDHGICYAMYVVTQPAVIAETSSTNLTDNNLQGCERSAPEYTSVITGLFRLDIGENFQENVV